MFPSYEFEPQQQTVFGANVFYKLRRNAVCPADCEQFANKLQKIIAGLGVYILHLLLFSCIHSRSPLMFLDFTWL